MSNKKLLFALIVFSVPASFICFYATNLILSDVANMFYMMLTRDAISSLPIFLIAVECAIVGPGILHYGTYPSMRKRLLRNHAAVMAVLSLVGAVCAVLTGAVIYGSFTAPYPFPGATILTLLFHVAVVAVSLQVLHRCRRPGPSERTVGEKIYRAARWVFMVIFTYYAFDRFGAVLWMPSYAQWGTLYKTAFFYLWLLLPVCLLLHHSRWRLGLYFNQKQSGILYPLIFLLIDLCLCAVVVTGGINDTQFISAISPALGIERLLSKPIITIIHFCLLTLPLLVSLAAALFKAAEWGGHDGYSDRLDGSTK